MKINQLYIVLVVCVLAVAGCRKIEPPVITDPESPDFRVELDVEGATKLLVAGDQNYYMNTSWEKDEDNVHTFIGNLAQYDCLDQCGEQLTIKIRDYQQSETPLIDILGALPLNQNYKYEVDSTIQGTPDTTVWNIGVDTNLDSTTTQLDWIINGVPINVMNSDLFTYSSTTEDRIDVGLLMTSDTLFNSIYTTRYFNGPNGPNGLGVAIDVSPAVQTMLNLDAIATGGVQPYVYNWSTGANTGVILNNNQTNEYCVTVTDGNADTTSTCIVFEDQNSMPPIFYFGRIAASSFTLPGQEAQEPNPLRLGIVTIEYTDRNGQFYSSELGAQSVVSSFIINAINDYDPNERDEAVMQLLLDFECDVFTETGQQLNLSSMDALFGIAYPN